MKIAVNTRLLIPNKLDGIGWFTYETLKRITKNHPEHEFLFFFDRKPAKEFIFSDNITPITLYPPARHPFLWYLWFEMAVPLALQKHKPDLFLSTDGYLSLKTNTPQLNVIHDINFYHYPKDLPYLIEKYYNYYFPKYAKKATRLATVSEYSKQDICNSYDINPNKIDVVYNGINKSYKPESEEQQNNTRAKLTNGCPYFLFVGSLHPRKNINKLFEAFDKFKQQKSSNFKLVIVGGDMFGADYIETAYNNLQFKEDVIFTGRAEPETLASVVSAATALTFIPYFEGFGIPIIEAMASKTAVITSNITSMPEIAGDAALLIDPFNIDSIVNGMLKIAFDDELRINLENKGLERANNFSWDKTADKLWNCIESATNA